MFRGFPKQAKLSFTKIYLTFWFQKSSYEKDLGEDIAKLPPQILEQILRERRRPSVPTDGC